MVLLADFVHPMHALRKFATALGITLATVLGLAATGFGNAALDLDVTAAVSAPAPPQPVPVGPSTPLADEESSAAPVSNSLADSQLAPAAAEKNTDRISLSAKSRFTPNPSRMGDTVEYRIEVTWQDSRVPVLVLAPDSVDFTGLTLVEQSTRHEKSAMGGKVENRTVFSYSLVPKQTGIGKAASLKVRYTTALSGQEEAVYAPAAQVEIRAARFAFLQSGWFLGLCTVVILAGLGGVLYAALKAGKIGGTGKNKSAETGPKDKRAQLVRDFQAVKARIGHGESREILSEMERLAIAHLRASQASATSAAGGTAQSVESAPPKFDTLLDAWLMQNRDDLDRTADWERLRELFRQARYAGGHKEPHELQDAWRAMKRCLNVTEES